MVHSITTRAHAHERPPAFCGCHCPVQRPPCPGVWPGPTSLAQQRNSPARPPRGSPAARASARRSSRPLACGWCKLCGIKLGGHARAPLSVQAPSPEGGLGAGALPPHRPRGLAPRTSHGFREGALAKQHLCRGAMCSGHWGSPAGDFWPSFPTVMPDPRGVRARRRCPRMRFPSASPALASLD